MAYGTATPFIENTHTPQLGSPPSHLEPPPELEQRGSLGSPGVPIRGGRVVLLARRFLFVFAEQRLVCFSPENKCYFVGVLCTFPEKKIRKRETSQRLSFAIVRCSFPNKKNTSSSFMRENTAVVFWKERE